MKSSVPKQTAGVWLDSQHAIIMAGNPESENGEYSIQAKASSNTYHGGKGEHAKNNADQSNLQQYFKSVANLLLKYDEILLFGPGKSQEQFLNFLNEDAHFQNKQITLDSAKHLTDAQMIAKVKDFFNSRLN